MEIGSRYHRTAPVVWNLIIINALVFLAQFVFGGLEDLSPINDWFALHHYRYDGFRVYQLITHMFMHGGFLHLLLNMLGLWMFGSMMEQVWGSKRLLVFFLICGVVAGLTQMGSYAYTFWNIDHSLLSIQDIDAYQQLLGQNATVGASGAIMGILAAYAYTFPNTELFIMPIPFPIKAKWAIVGIIGLDFLGGVMNSASDNVAHFAHIGGALCGLFIVFTWNRKNKKRFY
jgi:membrane associated rhomboid family serine protease